MHKFALALALLLSTASPLSINHDASATPVGDAPARLLDRVNIPFQAFTLANGLRVIVHEDRTTPVVAVNVWYNVGSKDEPVGRTGFAHLFEHLMFNGSPNAPGEYFTHMAAIGATAVNGTTWFDRTNYFETVPTGALARTLFVESDRMGQLMGAVTPKVLANQIGVVQNEKRQGDTNPLGLVEYTQLEDLFPAGHPYRHSTIGSMADLSAASLNDVRGWFHDRYGPNNAILVLAGDVSVAEARPLVERYFGDIPRGPVSVPAAAAVPTLPRRIDRTMNDRVANPTLYRSWAVPGFANPDLAPLSVAAAILGGPPNGLPNSSRLYNELVRGDGTALTVTAQVKPFHRVSIFEIQVDLAPGSDAEAVGRRLDTAIERLLREGPTEDEVRRAIMPALSLQVRKFEDIENRAGALAEGLLYTGDAGFYRRQLQRLAAVNPAEVRSAMQRWLGRPVHALTVSPGERAPYEEVVQQAGRMQEALGGAADSAMPVPPSRKAPPISGSRPPDFPAIEHARLANGIEVVFARRSTLPVTRIAVEFDAGLSADPADKVGLHNLMLALLTEGTTSRSATQLAEQRERLGVLIGTDVSFDRSGVYLSALTSNLAPSLELLADVIQRPAFAPAEFTRMQARKRGEIAIFRTFNTAVANEAMLAALYGTHPYGHSPIGDEATLRALTRDDVVRFYQSWIRPETARVLVVSDLPLATLLPTLESAFGGWRPSATVALGVKRWDVPPPAPRSRLILIDIPQSPQSLIMAGQRLAVPGTADRLTLEVANEVLAGNFLSRVNAELRERRGWSYGSQASLAKVEHLLNYQIVTSVQADRTGDSIASIKEIVRAFLSNEGVQPAELDRVRQDNIRALPARFKSSNPLLGELRLNGLLGRPDDYWKHLPGRYQALTAAQVDEAARKTIDLDRFVWVVVGDAAKVRPQLERLGMPIEERRSDGGQRLLKQ